MPSDLEAYLVDPSGVSIGLGDGYP